jgi:hypothetical protein
MSRKLKVIGVAALAVLAVSAVSPSVAQAEFTSAVEDTFLKGEQKTTNVLTTASGEVKCTTATFEGTMKGTAAGGLGFTSQTAKVHPTYSGCTAFGFAAEINTNSCEFELTAEGKVSVLNCPSTAPIKINIPIAGCNITVANQGPLSGVSYSNEGSPSSILVTETVTGITFTSSGGACGSSSSNGKFTGSALTKGFSDAGHTEQVGIEAAPARSTKLCKKEPNEVGEDLVCPAGEGYEGKIEGKLKAGKEATFKSTAGPTGEISCTEAELAGEFNMDGTSAGKGKGITQFAFHSGGGGDCTSKEVGGATPKVEVKMLNLPFDKSVITYVKEEEPRNGHLDIGDNPQLEFIIKTGEASNPRCKYVISLPVWFIFNGQNGEASTLTGPFSDWDLKEEEGNGKVICPAEVSQSGDMTFARPGGNLYVAKK